MFAEVCRSQVLLRAHCYDDYVAPDHVARFVVETVETMDLSMIEAHYDREQGRRGYAPKMMVSLLIYGMIQGKLSSRKLEAATYEHVPMQYICAGAHPDHDTIARFRRTHGDSLKSLFEQLLVLAEQQGKLKLGTVALDGTKVKANAALDQSVTAETAAKRLERYRERIEELLQALEDADRKDGGEIDLEMVKKELKRAEEQTQKLLKVKEQLEAEDEKKRQQAEQEYQQKQERREQHKAEHGSYPKGRKPKPPELEKLKPSRSNLTDEEAKLMKTKQGIMPAYNAQAGVDVDTHLIVTEHVTDAATDHAELEPTLEALEELPATLGQAEQVLADAGYYSGDNVEKCEQHQLKPYIAKTRKGTAPLPKTSKITESLKRMKKRMSSTDGQAMYGKRKSTVETVFGVIKQVLGFRSFTMRAKSGAQTQWTLACLAWNFKRLHKLSGVIVT